MAGGVGGISQQEQQHCCYLLWLTHSRYRLSRGNIIETIDHRGPNRTRVDQVGPDSMRPEFQCRALGQAAQTPFARHISSDIGVALQTRSGGNIDN